jgi:cytochrome c biogenesis protein CcmG, thiol:disulfide interchange protein DsbE
MTAVSSTLQLLRRALPWVVLFVGVFVLSKAVRPAAAFRVGEHLPEFRAELLDGTEFVLPKRPGRPLIVNFWATYCGPCREEAPLLANAERRGANVIGLSVETSASREQLDSAARRFGMTYPIALGNLALLRQFQIDTVPTTYVLAHDGEIVLSRVGKIGRSELDDALALAEKNP